LGTNDFLFHFGDQMAADTLSALYWCTIDALTFLHMATLAGEKQRHLSWESEKEKKRERETSDSDLCNLTKGRHILKCI
jgi:hypothetical protein